MRYLFMWNIGKYYDKVRIWGYNPQECFYVTEEEIEDLKDLYTKENIDYKIIKI